MRLAPSVTDFAKDPVGACVAGRTWLYFHPDPGLCGFVLWGRIEEAELERLRGALRTELRPGSHRHASLIDVRRLEDVEPAAFSSLGSYVRDNHARLGEVVHKLAIVRPAGLVGAMAAGFFGVEPPPYPVQVFDDAQRALEWLGRGDKKFLHILEARITEASGVDPLLRDLRALLDQKPGTVTLEDAARALGQSDRSLQRRLGELGTRFRDEVVASQVRVARAMLASSDTKLGAIADAVGCASLASFSAMFRRATGETPSACRARFGRKE